jgi:hypothetical protein
MPRWAAHRTSGANPLSSCLAPSLFLLFDGICLVKPASMVTVRDLPSGETIDVPVGELSAPTTSAGESDAVRLRAHIVRARPNQSRAVERREKLVMAAFIGEGPLRLRVEQTTAVSGISARTLWFWIARYLVPRSTARFYSRRMMWSQGSSPARRSRARDQRLDRFGLPDALLERQSSEGIDCSEIM